MSTTGALTARVRIDFLLERTAPTGVEAIVTNSPYKLAAEFVAHALDLCPRVVMLLRLAFLESERRSGILDGGQLARVHVFRNRLPMMHRSGWAGPKASSAIAFGWFVFDRNHQGPTVMDRISWTPVTYDAGADLAGSIREGLRFVKERMRRGGPSWPKDAAP